jgi:galactose mutarotase-like enzyme
MKQTGVSPAQPYLEDEQYWSYVLTDTVSNIEIPQWSLRNSDLGVPVPFSISKRTLHGGKQEGSTLIDIQTDALHVTLLPTRGMSVLDASSGDVELGWPSPVDEVVHPSFMNLDSRGGLGWLDGFNELMVRCGFEWTGHPCEVDGRRHTLHGRAGNTPASTVVVQIQKEAPHAIQVFGLLKEKTFKFSDLEIWTGLRVLPGEARIEIHDTVTNLCDYERPFGVIYHTNFGAPLLGAGSRIIAPMKEVSSFNDASQPGLKRWSTYKGATRGYDEEIFNCKAYADALGVTLAALVNADGTRGAALRYWEHQLPAFTLWKNTDLPQHGYVTGLEPGTNPPYPHTIERDMGRLCKLAPGESKSFDLAIEVLRSKEEVQRMASEVLQIQGDRATYLIAEQLRNKPGLSAPIEA